MLIMAFIAICFALQKKNKPKKIMKQVFINGKLVEFSRMESTAVLTEEINPNFIGYASEYYEDGKLIKLGKSIKFYK